MVDRVPQYYIGRSPLPKCKPLHSFYSRLFSPVSMICHMVKPTMGNARHHAQRAHLGVYASAPLHIDLMLIILLPGLGTPLATTATAVHGLLEIALLIATTTVALNIVMAIRGVCLESRDQTRRPFSLTATIFNASHHAGPRPFLIHRVVRVADTRATTVDEDEDAEEGGGMIAGTEAEKEMIFEMVETGYPFETSAVAKEIENGGTETATLFEAADPHRLREKVDPLMAATFETVKETHL